LREVYIIDGARTPFGEFCGSLRDIKAIDLGAIAARGAFERSRIKPEMIDQVVFGNVLHTSSDAIYGARHVALKSGVPMAVPALTVNRIGGSGLQALISGAQMIRLKEAEVCLVGGMENMSQSPQIVRNTRSRAVSGYSYMEDSLWMALIDSYNNMMMVDTAENIAEKYSISREEQLNSEIEILKSQSLANEVVVGNGPVIARFVSRAELDEMPLRKMPVVDGPIRIVQIDDFDWSPCGGTHVVNTGQVGLVKVTRIERRKKQSRVHFLCGRRALADYDQKQGVVRDVVAHLTTSEDELLSSVQRLEAEIKRLRKTLNEAQMQLLEQELAEWIAQAEPIGELRVVCLAFEDRDPVLLREAARRLTEEADVVALLATSLPSPQFVFARPEDVTADMGALMRAACAAVGGRGGGRPQFAQGGAPEGASAVHALEAAVEQLRMG